MDKFFHSRFFRFLVCLLLVLAFLVNCSPIRARAVAAETFMVTLEAFISACLIGLGLSPQVGNYSPFNQIVSDCKEYLQTATADGLEIVSSGSQLMLALTYPGQGSYYVRKNFLDTIKDWLFSSNTISVNTPVTSNFYDPVSGYTLSCTGDSPVYVFRQYHYYQKYYVTVFLLSEGSFTVSGSISGSSSLLTSPDRFEYFKVFQVSFPDEASQLSYISSYSVPFYYWDRSSSSAHFQYDFLCSASSVSYPDSIEVSDVVPQIGEDIDITYIDWKELEKQLNEVGSDGEGDDSEDPTNPMIHIPYWPIWSPQFSDPDATLDDVLQSDVWTKGASSTWDPSHTGTSTGSDTSGSWKPPSDHSKFALGDLSKFFPFCIPFDLFDFFLYLMLILSLLFFPGR